MSTELDLDCDKLFEFGLNQDCESLQKFRIRIGFRLS